MNLRGFQIKTAILIFSLVLLSGLGVQYLHQRTQVLQPLTRELQELTGVEDVTIAQSGLVNRSRAKIGLKLAEDVPLAVSLGQVYQILKNHGGFYLVELEDQASSELLKHYQKAQLIIEEAIFTGEFALLEKRMELLAEGKSLQWELGVDRDFVYLRLYNENAKLERAIPRDQEGNKVQMSFGGWING